MKDHKAGYLSDEEHYEELSQLVKKSYSGHPEISVYIELDQIWQWIQQQQTKPLLISCPQFGGTKTLLCQFLQSCSNRQNCISISEFASASPYYSQLLYKITMQLRNHLDINQKVQLNQEKLRQYFSYWLQVADQKIQMDYLGYVKDEKLKIIILIQGVDQVVDAKGNLVRPSFWLPDIHLRNIKIIYTVHASSTSAIQCLKPTISHKMEYIISAQKQAKITHHLKQAQPKLQKFNEQTHFGDLKTASKVLNSHPKLTIQQNNISFAQFLNKFIQYLSGSVDNIQNICRMLACLIWSKKGISRNTLRRSFRFSPDAVDKMLSSVQDFIIVSDDSYLIINRKLKQYLTQIIVSRLGPEQTIKRQVHTLLAKALKKQTYTLNVLQELIFHQISSGNFTELKQLLSRIENFLVLYTPLTKHLLCMCWFQLQIQFQYDPVFEYNKAIQRFLNHYYPSPEDTFKIIFQLSLFFKEYSEFENSKTPQFRHPPIRGQIEQLKQISILDELIHMNMYQKSKPKNKQTLKQSIKGKKQTTEKQKQLEKPKQNHKQKQMSHQVQASSSRLSIIQGVNQQIEAGEEGEKKQVQKLNVRIKFHQQKFKNLYLKEMEPYLNEFYVIKKKSLMNKNNQILDEDSDDSENQMDQSKIDVQRMKKGLMLKKFSDYCEEEYHRSSEKRSFYYYKQWIWMQFPWICQSLNHHYSEMIEKCMKSPTEYMSIEVESKLISEAVKIAKIAKQNKRQIYDNSIKLTNQSKDLASRPANHQSLAEKSIILRSNAKYKPGASKYKQKFDVNQIDVQLQKCTKPKKMKKNESSIFMTDLSGNQSLFQDKTDKQNSVLSTSRLPNILKCSTVVGSRVEKNLSITDTRQYNLLVAKYDELRHENEHLMQKIQSIQYNREHLKQNNKDNLRDILKGQIEDIKERKIKIAKNYQTQESLKAKLEMILKLCDFNKSHGSESADLHNFLNSLKTMFKIQEQNLEQINQQGKKILQDSKLSYRQLKQQKSAIWQKLKKQKARLSKCPVTMAPQKELQKQQSKSKYQQKKKKNELSKQDSKRKQKYEKQIDHLNHQLMILNQKFGFVAGQDKVNQEVFQKFQEHADKLNQIQWKLHELIDENNSRDRELVELEDKLEVSKGYRQHKKQVKKRGLESLINQEMLKKEERIKCLQRCFTLVDEAKSHHVTHVQAN